VNDPPLPIDIDLVKAEPCHLVVRGEIDVSVEDVLVDAVTAAFTTAGSALVLDLRAVSFIDSSGIRALLRCQQAAAVESVRLALSVVAGPVTRVMALAGVSERFEYV
jgi:anti-anti-sigma factor